MCGIIGYLGGGDPVRIAAEGLKMLEYRGYDSAGVAYFENSQIKTIKAVGHVAALAAKISEAKFSPTGKTSDGENGGASIAHTRWATHGEATELNAHPHLSADGNFAVVHNGIIENHAQLGTFLSENGIALKSQTDTEVIPNLLQYFFAQTGMVVGALQLTLKKLRGSYAFVVMSAHSPDKIIAAKHGNQPLTIGVGDGDAPFMYITSDLAAALAKTDRAYTLNDDEFALITHKDARFFTFGGDSIKKPLVKKTKNTEFAAKKGNFATFMEKEINEIPQVFKRLIKHYGKKSNKATTTGEARLHEAAHLVLGAGCVHLAACGTAYHAALTLGQLLETHCNIRTRVYIASEFHSPLITKGDIGIVISQSGETADTLAALKLMKARRITTLAFCNVATSTMAHTADLVLPTLAGPEFAVASTKAYCAQVLLGALLANQLYTLQHGVPLYPLAEFRALPALAQQLLGTAGGNNNSGNSLGTADTPMPADFNKVFFLGKGLSAITALEAALKVKEITYMHCEGYPSGELKHGTLSLIDDKTLVIVFDGEPAHSTKIANNTEEVRARGGKVITIKDHASPLGFACNIIHAQRFALRLAQQKGLDPDKPRNLAKSVTVE